MSERLRYLSVERVIRLHLKIMTQMGAPEAPLRSPALLESALLRPQQLAHYQGADIAKQATALAVGISQNQPFLDGNKRAAYLSMVAFLQMNAYSIDAEPLSIAEHLMHVAERSDDREAAVGEFTAWIRERLRPLDAAT